MSPDETQRTLSSSMRTSWASVAFILESVLLLLFLVASLAVLTQVFSKSLSSSVESRTLDAAVIAASSIAEHFAADPAQVDEETQLGDLRVTCAVTDEQRAAGTMYYAHIDVYDAAADGAEPVYSLDTASYQSDSQPAQVVQVVQTDEPGETGESDETGETDQTDQAEQAEQTDEADQSDQLGEEA